MQKLLPFLLPLFMFASCASTGIHQLSEEQPMRISYITQRGKFELSNPAHTDPVKLYSTTRPRVSPMKVTKDAIMIDIIEFLGSNGFSEHETTGSHLDSGLVGYSVVFEVESKTGVSHWGITRVSTEDEIKQLSKCRDYFFNIWNNVEAFQTVDNQKGDFSFQGN